MTSDATTHSVDSMSDLFYTFEEVKPDIAEIKRKKKEHTHKRWTSEEQE